jgi:hypothetical protein
LIVACPFIGLVVLRLSLLNRPYAVESRESAGLAHHESAVWVFITIFNGGNVDPVFSLLIFTIALKPQLLQ